MRRQTTRSRVLLWISAVVGVAFLVAALVVGILYPLKGLPFYSKLLIGGIFFVGVVYSFYLEKKGDPVVPQNDPGAPEREDTPPRRTR